MTASTSIVADASIAAGRLGSHPQDHGWRDLYRVIAQAFGGSAVLGRLAGEFRALRPMDSDPHFVTLLGIAIKAADPAATTHLVGQANLRQRIEVLDHLIEKNFVPIRQTILSRQNSFTCARRFLVPQVVLSAIFARTDELVRFADLGTGLGILPRQLNSEVLFERFTRDLRWPGGVPAYRAMPLRSRCGVDRGPLPDLAWVRACYGASDYYDHLYGELVGAIDATRDAAREVAYEAVDLLDQDGLAAVLRRRAINSVNLSYVLYELRPPVREAIVETASAAMRAPGVAIVIEPQDDLAGRGCTVTIHGHRHGPLRVLRVSDGHFRGAVAPLEDFGQFLRRYPVRFLEDAT